MVRSMTGFGACETEYEGIPISVEIKAVNHRYFDFNCHVTRGFSFLEEKLKSYIQSKVARGKVDVFVSVGSDDSSPCEILINHSLASGYIKAFKELRDTYGIESNITANILSRFPDVLTVRKAPADEERIWLLVKGSTDIALDSFIKMRCNEGEKLKVDVLNKAKTILDIVSIIESKSSLIVEEYKARLEEKIKAILENNSIDEQRVLTEVAIFADKVAVDEEITRLRSHFDQLYRLLDCDEAIGRKLDFLLQEMNREANTIGSKVTNAEVAHLVVNIKAELEKIREQIQNIE